MDSSESQTTSSLIREGKANILLSESLGTIFYNKVQEFNRDLSVATLRVFEKIYRQEQEQKQSLRPRVNHDGRLQESYIGLRILEAFSATGLRAIRYAKEVDGVREVLANDYNHDAVSTIENTVLFNELSLEKVRSHFGDAK